MKISAIVANNPLKNHHLHWLGSLVCCINCIPLLIHPCIPIVPKVQLKKLVFNYLQMWLRTVINGQNFLLCCQKRCILMLPVAKRFPRCTKSLHTLPLRPSFGHLLAAILQCWDFLTHCKPIRAMHPICLLHRWMQSCCHDEYLRWNAIWSTCPIKYWHTQFVCSSHNCSQSPHRSTRKK